MTTRTSRPTATARQLTLLREGEATVRIVRPWDPPLPEGLVYGYLSQLPKTEGRRAFYPDGHSTQACRVHYRVWSDPLMLADLAARSLRNLSGTAVRGWATARDGKVDLNMTEAKMLVMAQAAANHASLVAVEGPVRCRVTLIDRPQGTPPKCQYCHLGVDAHEVYEDHQLGKWVGGRTRDGHYDAQAERIDRYYLCPQVTA